ncbi:hypothetical protein DL767_004133 [Monosporascus sp. MG133]|nr:hypothetical protein DL767_004133 [Monosporascus sp. MG133]
MSLSKLLKSKSEYKAFKVAVRNRWDADNIKKIEERLNSIQNALQLRVLINIKKRLDGTSDGKLNKSFNLLEQLLDAQLASRKDTGEVIDALERQVNLGANHNELLAQLGGVKARTVPGSPGPLAGCSQKVDEEAEEAKRKAERAILNSLWYRNLYDREGSIFDP